MAIPAWLTAKAVGTAVGKAAPYALAIGQSYMDKRAQDRAFEQNKQFWFERFEKEAQYNSPVEQKARMMAAGLNPALMYKGGQTGGNVSGGSAQGKIAERYQLTELAKMSAEVGEIQSRTKLNEAEAKLKGQRGDLFTAQTAGVTLDNQMKEILKGEYSEQQKQETKRLTEQALMLTEQRTKLEAETANIEKQNLIMQKELDAYENVYKNYMALGMDPNGNMGQQLLQFIVNLGKAIYDIGKAPVMNIISERF